MKKILIVASDMEIGGAERALLGFLDAIDTTQFHVDLFLFKHCGSFLKLIPEKINLLSERKEYSCIAVPLPNAIKKRCFGVVCGRIFGKIKTEIYLRKNHIITQNSVGLLYSIKYTIKHLPTISDDYYDLAIGFTTPYYVVDQKVSAKRKVVWIHTDYSKEFSDKKTEELAWSVYDKLIGVSDSVCKAFASLYPKLESRIMEMDNIVSASIIRQQASEFSVTHEMPDDGYIKILSVGRFCYAKNFDNVPIICRKILNQGIKIRWFLIGFGSDEELIRQRIREANVSENVIILEKKDNPYPYIKNCDLYVQPSRFEGRCVTVTEAQILNKPVIITNYATSASQLTDGYDGVIVPMDNRGCAEGIARVIKDKTLQQRLIENTKMNDYTNREEIDKLYSLMERRNAFR